jgi:hypothetical protein
MLHRDLQAANVPVEIDGPDGIEVRDFHALRACFISDVIRTGADLKQAMTLARHSDPKLTAGRYARTRLHDLGGVVNKLPNPSATQQENTVLRLTGTDGKSDNLIRCGAAPGAADGGNGRERLKTIENVDGVDEPAHGTTKPLVSQGFEGDRGRLGVGEEGKPPLGFEPRTPALRKLCSTAELRRRLSLVGILVAGPDPAKIRNAPPSHSAKSLSVKIVCPFRCSVSTAWPWSSTCSASAGAPCGPTNSG